jgi:hypothetical protein
MRMKWARIECMGQIIHSCDILIGKLEENRPFERERSKWKEYINVLALKGGLESSLSDRVLDVFD